MTTHSPRAGTAFVDAPGSRAAGEKAALDALDAAGLDAAELAFCFHHGRHDPTEVLAGVRDALGSEVRIVGGTAMGIITNSSVSYEGHEVGIAVLGGLPASSTVFASATGLAGTSEHSVGAALGAALAAQANGSELDVVLLYSSIKRGLTHPDGLALNFGTPLLTALQAALGPARSVAGAGLIDSIQPTHSHVFTDAGTDADAAVAIGFRNGLRVDTVVLHGCRPAGSYHTITRTEGPVVLEIDDRPALDVIDELLDGALTRAEYPFNVILGVNHADRYAPFDEESYQTRLCLAVDEDRRGLVMFEPDLEPGSLVQLMRVSTHLDYAKDRVAALLGRLDGRTPLLALYADCAGRCVMGSAMPDEEGHAVRAAIGDIPLLGFYTGVEIGPVAGMAKPLDWTGVLCLLSV
ncbi:MAG TPA: FIST N-terminal domain-containing protein [Mycobacteriales bacterium]|nr:FIST N-terminal domain-containing protein [Mycobacteriales bacterium]